LRDLAEGFVAREVTVVVVVELEVVDIEQSNGEGSAGPDRLGVDAGEIFLHAAPVPEARQGVGE
jgi:hypothetical protein